jgi:hypothetical protein
MDRNVLREALGLPVYNIEPCDPDIDLADCAWNYPGRVLYTGKRDTGWTSKRAKDGRIWDNPSQSQKFLLLAVARLQTRGIPATPVNVAQVTGNAVATCRRRLRWMAGFLPSWYLRAYGGLAYYEWSPLTRHKHGRTFRYTLNKPVITKDW